MGIRGLVKQVLTEKENRRYQRLLAQKVVSYEQWRQERESRIGKTLEFGEWENSKAREAAFGRDGLYHIFYLGEGHLSLYAEQIIAGYFAEHPEVELVYGDEDVQGTKLPWFKPDWSPDLLDNWYYLGSVVAVRKTAPFWRTRELEPLLFHASDSTEADRKRVLAFLRSCLEACGGWKKGCQAIGHIPEILFHCDSEAIWEEYMQWGREEGCQDNNDMTPAPLLSVVIPSKDQPDILAQCLRVLPEAAGRLQWEVIVVDNGSREENKRRVEAMLRDLENTAGGQGTSKYLYYPMEFNFSKMCNLGAEASEGSLLLFLNDDVELYQEGCLERMAVTAGKEYAGAVGMKLYYPASRKIQHSGITNLPMGPVHKLQFLEDTAVYYFKANRGKRNVLAVTAACLMVDKEKYREVQGFSEELKVAFNDVDFCFKLYENGYFNVCDNELAAYHHESLSRGDDETDEKWKRLQAEREELFVRHPQLEGRDPYYGAGLGREGLDTRIRPAYETAGNHPQKTAGGVLPFQKIASYRQDNCLLLRVENCRQGSIQGYGVVLGDNNACYDKEIVLEKISSNPTENQEKTDVIYYTFPVEGQYRPDLAENMPDQTNVGLSGFWIQAAWGRVGQYRIGILARNRVTGLRLVNWSNRIFTLE